MKNQFNRYLFLAKMIPVKKSFFRLCDESTSGFRSMYDQVNNIYTFNK